MWTSIVTFFKAIQWAQLAAKIVSKLPWNQGKPKVQLAVLALVVLVALGAATQCRSAESSYRSFGAGVTLVRGTAAMVDLALVYPEAGPGDSTIEVGATFIGESDFRGDLQRNNFAVRTAVIDGFGRFDVGIGLAYLQNTDEYNGSHLNFNLILGYRFKNHPGMLRISHFSNGGTVSPNRGRDMIFYAYRF